LVHNGFQFSFLFRQAYASFCLDKNVYASAGKRKEKKKLAAIQAGFLFRMGLHLKIMFIIANALTKPGFYLSFVLLAFERESFAALSAANLDLDFLALHMHPPVCSRLTPLVDSAVTRLGCPFSADFNLFLALNGPQR
jgi:hypothetical protein